MAPVKPDMLVAYADGSCLGNPGPGGWGVLVLQADGSALELSGGEPSTTNNRMEITAAIEALRALPSGVEVTIRSDSQYVVNTMTLGWKRNQNIDLWQQLDAEAAQRKVKFEWVRGHAGDTFNSRADELALNAAKQVAKAGRDIFSRKAAATTAKPAIARDADEDEDAVVGQLRSLLEGGETLARCQGCGRMFVAWSVPTISPYCTLASCQLKARRRAPQR